MDDFNLQGDEMQELLTDLKRVNKMLGGNAISLNGIGQLLEGRPANNTITILDIGCGDGEMLRQCAKCTFQRTPHLTGNAQRTATRFRYKNHLDFVAGTHG